MKLASNDEYQNDFLEFDNGPYCRVLRSYCPLWKNYMFYDVWSLNFDQNFTMFSTKCLSRVPQGQKQTLLKKMLQTFPL